MVRACARLAPMLLVALAACGGDNTTTSAPGSSTSQPAYHPAAQYCVQTPGGPATGLCSTIPGNIGPDPALDQTIAYNGIVGTQPTSAATDPQTPFDNLSWQTFVAINWTKGKESAPAQEGLQGTGLRVWQAWPKFSQMIGNSPSLASCNVPASLGLQVFQIGSDGHGAPAGQNDEYIQAATGLPAIDISGNWTIYERRLNDVEVAYLQAPDGNKTWNLTTTAGQTAFAGAGKTVDFPSVDTTKTTGAIELKVAWRILDPAKRAANQQKYYVVPAMVTVPPDLVTPATTTPICAVVDLGLVAMHIIQKNPPVSEHNLKREWFWSTFEHVENAPLAANACDPTKPDSCGVLGETACPAKVEAVDYSYFNIGCPGCVTNQAPPNSPPNGNFLWSPAQPFASTYLAPVTSQDGKPLKVGTQVSRCWQVYSLTQELNAQWRGQLRAIGSVFQNYFLVGTQWGANLTNAPNPKLPPQVVPNFLANSIVETYLQNAADPKNPFQNGSCITCHRAATLAVGSNTADFSFLPGDVTKAGLKRRPPIPTKP